MVLDDRTHYDIGEPFISVRFSSGTLAHTPQGIVVSCDNGTRYTCSYNRLISMLKASSRVPSDFVEQYNINDIVDTFKRKCDKMLADAEKRNNEINKEYETK